MDTFPSVGCDLTRDTCPDLVMAGVTVRLGVRPSATGDTASPYNQTVELVINTPDIRSVQCINVSPLKFRIYKP